MLTRLMLNIRILFTNYDIIADFLNLAFCYVKWKSSPEGKDTESMVGVYMDKLSDVSQL
jgi:hypothetical protein